MTPAALAWGRTRPPTGGAEIGASGLGARILAEGRKSPKLRISHPYGESEPACHGWRMGTDSCAREVDVEGAGAVRICPHTRCERPLAVRKDRSALEDGSD